MSANEYLIDASTRHQIMLQRLSGGAFNKLKPLLEKLQKDVKARLRDDPTDFQMKAVKVYDQVDNRTVGIFTDGKVFLAMSWSVSKTFKTEEAAYKWLVKFL